MTYESKILDGKMMLISRDIKHKGQKFSVLTNEGLLERTFKEIHNGLIWTEESNAYDGYVCFKVIGKISLQATWVKEGDKFEHLVDCWISNSEIDQPDTFKIKGPCGHFH